MNTLVFKITPLLLFTNDYGMNHETTMNVFDVMLGSLPLEETICFLRLELCGKLTLLMNLDITYIKQL